MAKNPVVEQLLARLRAIREGAGKSCDELDQELIFGPGWTARFESGQTVPSLDVLVVILDALGSSIAELLEGISVETPVPDATTSIDRFIHAELDDDDLFGGLLVHFGYADHDAVYRLEGATEDEFETVVKTLRDGLALLVTTPADDQEAIKTNAVANAYLKAVELWPKANASDLWWFVVYRAYLDSFNHPARYARLDLGQSWKRTGGWALEEVLVRRYREALAAHRIRIFIAYGNEKAHYLSQLEVADRLESDKVDVLLVGEVDDDLICFGVVHVKSSFAERRTDDVPMSKALVEAGYTRHSGPWTARAPLRRSHAIEANLAAHIQVARTSGARSAATSKRTATSLRASRTTRTPCRRQRPGRYVGGSSSATSIIPLTMPSPRSSATRGNASARTTSDPNRRPWSSCGQILICGRASSSSRRWFDAPTWSASISKPSTNSRGGGQPSRLSPSLRTGLRPLPPGLCVRRLRCIVWAVPREARDAPAVDLLVQETHTLATGGATPNEWRSIAANRWIGSC